MTIASVSSMSKSVRAFVTLKGWYMRQLSMCNHFDKVLRANLGSAWKLQGSLNASAAEGNGKTLEPLEDVS